MDFFQILGTQYSFTPRVSGLRLLMGKICYILIVLLPLITDKKRLSPNIMRMNQLILWKLHTSMILTISFFRSLFSIFCQLLTELLSLVTDKKSRVERKTIVSQMVVFPQT